MFILTHKVLKLGRATPLLSIRVLGQTLTVARIKMAMIGAFSGRLPTPVERSHAV